MHNELAPLAFRPIFLIGAARSGTKFVRDTIGLHPQIDVVPYDINYIWRLGNEKATSDALTVEQATPEVIAQIRQEFAQRFHKGAPFVIEKTVSNALRVPFINRIFPEAYYLHLVRDGRDVIESVQRQWTAKPDWRYLVQKALQFPYRKALGYAWSYGVATLQRTFGKQQSQASVWGPRYPGVDADLQRYDLLEVCALQWHYCVQMASDDLAQLPDTQWQVMRYEALVQDPSAHMVQIASAIGLDPQPFEALDYSEIIAPGNVGKGARRLGADELAQATTHMQASLERYGYTTPILP